MSGVMIPWLWLLLAVNVVFGVWGCLDDLNGDDFFPFGFFVLEGVGLFVWLFASLGLLVLESTGAL